MEDGMHLRNLYHSQQNRTHTFTFVRPLHVLLQFSENWIWTLITLLMCSATSQTDTFCKARASTVHIMETLHHRCQPPPAKPPVRLHECRPEVLELPQGSDRHHRHRDPPRGDWRVQQPLPGLLPVPPEMQLLPVGVSTKISRYTWPISIALPRSCPCWWPACPPPPCARCWPPRRRSRSRTAASWACPPATASPARSAAASGSSATHTTHPGKLTTTST